jgi:hypothetical protein
MNKTDKNKAQQAAAKVPDVAEKALKKGGKVEKAAGNGAKAKGKR